MKRIIIGAAVLTGLASLGVAGAACTSAAAPAAHNRVQVLRLHTVFASLAVNHAGHGGPGDVTAVVFDLQTPAGAEAGKAYLRSRREYTVKIGPDGSFRVADVPAGNYVLSVRVTEPHDPRQSSFTGQLLGS